MSADRVPMTTRGWKNLNEELRRLKEEERPKVSKALHEAAARGDLSENAEYHAAKEKQAFLEKRIGEIEDKLAKAQVVEPSTISSDRVLFGATVRILDTDTEEEITYQIVGSDEADTKNGKISVFSPIAKALLGKSEGDVVKVQVPRGIREFEIMEITYC